MENKKGLEMSFVWIFAIVIGSMIIVLAVYFAVRFINTEQMGVNTQTAREFANLFDPLQTSIEESRVPYPLELITETRVFTSCNNNGDFGKSIIQLAERSAFREHEFSEPGGDISLINQYIFSENQIEGKKFYFFVKSIRMPFKLADLMMVYTDKYCFVGAPSEIETEIANLGGESHNLIVKESSDKCGNAVIVCFNNFNNEECQVNVVCSTSNCESGEVKKSNKRLYFTQGLMYGAIFSSPENYKCNVQRIAKRLAYLSKLYADKAAFVSARGCETGLFGDMMTLKEMAEDYEDLEDLAVINNYAIQIQSKNEPSNLICQLF